MAGLPMPKCETCSQKRAYKILKELPFFDKNKRIKHNSTCYRLSHLPPVEINIPGINPNKSRRVG
jgi:hypothetical protein